MKSPDGFARKVACVAVSTSISAWYIAILLLVTLCGCGGGSGSGGGSGGNSGSGPGSGSGGGGSTPPPPALTTRTKYIRTDASTPYSGWINHGWIVYDAGSDRFFVSDPFGNRITVLDATAEKVVANIPVPGAYGIDFTPDHSVLYAGTQIGDVYAIDPVALKVTRRYIASHIGPYGYQAYAVDVLKDGRLALLGGQGGIPSIDGYSSFAIWDPSTNAFTLYTTGYSSGLMLGSDIPFVDACPDEGNIAAFFLSPDRTHIITSSIDSDGTICSMDAITGQSVETSRGGFILHLVATPDGTELVQPGGPNGYSQVFVYDAKTLSLIRSFPVVADTSSGTAVAVSTDSKTVYLDGDALIYAYDIATGNLVGWIPRLTVEGGGSGSAVGSVGGADFQAISSSGLLAGPMEEGVGFIDTASLQTGPPGSRFLNAFLTPATGPSSGGTQVQWSGAANMTPAAVYFGRNLATGVSADSRGLFYATTPAGISGPVDVYSLMPDGGMQVLPEAFSYGPTILEVTPDSSTAEGGGVGIVFGYGFGPVVSNCSAPSDLQVTVAGNPVKIVGYGCGQPQAVAFTIPAGTPGTSADIVVSTSSGSAKLSGAMHYLPAMQSYPLAGAAMAQGVYDPGRNLYYFTDAGVIEVFSRSTNTWQAPIPVPAPPSGKSHRLWGIALSADASQLAVSDTGVGAIYVMNPGNPSTAKTFTLTPSIPGTIPVPGGLVISDSGVVYFAAQQSGVTGADEFFKLDTASGVITPYPVQGPGLADDYLLRAAISSDGARVYFNNDGAIFSIDTATNSISWSATGTGCCYGDDDLSLSPDQTQFAATGYLYDADLNGDAFLSLNDREVVNTTYVYGAKLSADGTLLFQPLTGQTGTGIAVVDLSSLPEPTPLAYPSVVGYSGQNWTAWSMPRSASKPAARMSVVPHEANKLVQRPVLIPSTSAQHE